MTALPAIAAPGFERVWAALPELRIAGGAVRDSLLGVAVSDVDFASPLSPQLVIERLARAGIKSVPTGIAHGTVTAVVGKRGFEITTLRRDVVADGRHAVVEFTDDWQLDAARRDFTINAMSMARDGTVFDYFNGQDDLRAGIVRFVGVAETRIAEDYLRILRFFRFFARYAKGEPDGEAIRAILRLRDGVKQLSAERVWSESKRILEVVDPRIAIGLMEKTGVLQMIFHDAANIPRLDRMVAFGAPAEPMLRVAALFGGDVAAFAARLKLSGDEQELLHLYRAPGLLSPASSDADLRRALAERDPNILLAQSWLAQDDAAGWDALRRQIAATARPAFPLQGRDIVALGASPGPAVGDILGAVRAWWRENGCVDDLQACVAQARRLLSV